MNTKPKKVWGQKKGKPRRGKPISVESAVFLFGLFSTINDREVLERLIRLALRSQSPLADKLREFFRAKGEDVDGFLGAEASKPSSMAEAFVVAEPILKKGVEAAILAQMADTYLFNTKQSPKNLVYAFYNGVRFVIAGENEPTKEQNKKIWDWTLLIARNSRIGAPHWEKLEKESPFALKDWLDPIKETARKRYETFLNRKRRAERTAEESLKEIISDIFGDDKTT